MEKMKFLNLGFKEKLKPIKVMQHVSLSFLGFREPRKSQRDFCLTVCEEVCDNCPYVYEKEQDDD